MIKNQMSIYGKTRYSRTQIGFGLYCTGAVSYFICSLYSDGKETLQQYYRQELYKQNGGTSEVQLKHQYRNKYEAFSTGFYNQPFMRFLEASVFPLTIIPWIGSKLN